MESAKGGMVLRKAQIAAVLALLKKLYKNAKLCYTLYHNKEKRTFRHEKIDSFDFVCLCFGFVPCGVWQNANGHDHHKHHHKRILHA